MEKEKELAISRMVDEFGWSKKGAKIYVNMFSNPKDIDWRCVKNYKKTHFLCEICGCLTPYECEGSEPKTCAMCMPLANDDKERYNGYNQRY